MLTFNEHAKQTKAKLKSYNNDNSKNTIFGTQNNRKSLTMSGFLLLFFGNGSEKLRYGNISGFGI